MSTIKPTFEFLSSFEQWEGDCLRNPVTVDTLPSALQGCKNWTVQSQLLATLMGYNNLENIAKNGRPESKKKNECKITGYPGVVQGEISKDSDTWKEQIFTPKPEDLTYLPEGSCLIKVSLRLQSPFFSRDDRPFYPTENVLKRQWAFHVPYLAAAGIKGLLSWAYRMNIQNAQLDSVGQKLFGLANDTSDIPSHQGSVYTYPLFWQGKLGLEVINPQNPSTGAGTQPVKYEVVLPKSTGDLYLLLTVPPSEKQGNSFIQKHLPPLLQALKFLLEHGGLSAKKTADWGNVSIEGVNIAVKGLETSASGSSQADVDALWSKVEDGEGNLLPYDEKVFTTAVFADLLDGTEMTKSKIKKEKDKTITVYPMVQDLHATQRKKEGGMQKEAISPPQWLYGEKNMKSLDTLQQNVLALLTAEA